MGVKLRSKSSSDRQKWDKIFNALVKMVRTGQEQLETLVEERKILEDRIKLQHDRWVSDVRLYEGYISQMKSDLEVKEMACSLEAAKTDMLVGLKLREASVSKLKLEEIEDELRDFRCLFDLLASQKNISQKNASKVDNEISGGTLSSLDSASSKTFEGELRRLKLECEAIAMEKNSQVAALFAENKFIRNQFNLLERDLTDKLKSKDTELREAHKNIEALIVNIEELNSSAFEKDKIIERLKAEVSQKEVDIKRLDEELSRTSKELDLLRKTRNSSVTPVIKHHTAGERTSVLGSKNGGSNGRNVVVKKEFSSAQVADAQKKTQKGSRSSKRKGEDVILISEIPRLITSSFKVPKLKSPSYTR